MARRNIAFQAVIKPVNGQLLLGGYGTGDLAKQRSGLEKCINVFCRKTGVECEHHHRAAEQANLTDNALLAELIRKGGQRTEDRLASQGRTNWL